MSHPLVTDRLVLEALCACGNKKPSPKHIALMRTLLSSIGLDPDCLSRACLSEREKVFLFWVAKGRSNAEIGRLMSIDNEAVKTFIQEINFKLKSNTLAQSVFEAIRHHQLSIFDVYTSLQNEIGNAKKTTIRVKPKV